MVARSILKRMIAQARFLERCVMVIFNRRGHPVEKVHQDMRSLVTALNAVPPQFRAVGGQHGLAADDISGPYSNFRDLQRAVQREFVAWSADGETSRIETKNIADCFRLFGADLKRLYQRHASTDQKFAVGLLKDVTRAANQLARAIKGLQESVASKRVRVVRRHTHYPEQFLKIRQAMVRMNPEAAKQLRGQEVDPWCEWPGRYLDLGDSHQVDAIAKLVLLSWEENQTYELRCRSKAPGRPLKFMTWYPDFPSEEDLFTCAELFKRPGLIYVAAAKPTWRIVWVFDRETEGW